MNDQSILIILGKWEEGFLSKMSRELSPSKLRLLITQFRERRARERRYFKKVCRALIQKLNAEVSS